MPKSHSLQTASPAQVHPDGGRDEHAPSTSDGLEAGTVFVLILFHIWFVSRHAHMAWVIILPPVIYSHWAHGESLAWLGFRLTNFNRCVREFAPLILGLAGVPLLLGAVFGTLHPPSPWRQFWSTAYYCVWGTFQQYALNGFFVNRVSGAASPSEQRWVPLVAATMFALVHAPNWFLMTVTFTLGVLCARIYLMYRNLYFLGIAHGLIGSMLYISVPTWLTMHYFIGPRVLRYLTEVAVTRP